MPGKILFEGVSPKTQSVEAVKALLSWMGRDVELLPDHVQLDGARLTKSSKGDVYYMVTPTACSCPARCYHPGEPCKHMTSLLTGNGREASRAQARAYQARQRALREQARTAPSAPEPTEGPRRLARPPEDERPHVAFKPFLEDGKVAAGVV